MNVVNAGHSIEPFPPELQQYHIHLVDDVTFAATVMQIQKATGDLLLTLKGFAGDLIMWILNHFEGALEISVSGKIMFSKTMGIKLQSCSIVVLEDCTGNLSSCHAGSFEIALAEIVGDCTNILLQGIGESALKPRSLERQRLYSTENLVGTTLPRKSILNLHERNHVTATAKQIMNWLLSLPLCRPNSYKGFTFIANPRL